MAHRRYLAKTIQKYPGR